MGVIVVWSDVACPWATAALHNLRQARTRMGLDADVQLHHRAFPLELVNARPTPRRIVDAEIPVVGRLAPDFGWQTWPGDPAAYPGTVLLALEAVQAAKEQSVWAAEQLDYGLRRAFFADGRPISIRSVILEVAAACPEVDGAALEDALDDGRGRRAVITDWRAVDGAGVKGSPHLFLPDGTDVANPGVTMHWQGQKPGGFPVIDGFDAGTYEDLLNRAK
jgi:predicted DsbA family dithiol-disulfide isomerase